MQKKALFVNLPERKPLPHAAALQIAAQGYQVQMASQRDEAKRLIGEAKLDLAALILNTPCGELLRFYRQHAPQGQSLLLSELTLEAYAPLLNFEHGQLLDHVIAHTSNLPWVLHNLRVTLQKILSDDIFGLEKYLQTQANIVTRSICDSSLRRKCNQEVMDYVLKLKAGNHLAKLAYGICEELLMNALYDAPKDQEGQHLYGHVQRSQPICLKPEEAVTLSYGSDSHIFAVGVSDPFGGLKREKFHAYIDKVLRRQEGEGIIDKKPGGAGLGLFKILYSSHALICNSAPGKKTEVIALIHLHEKLKNFSKMVRGLHFFSVAET